ncbi:MAG: hypothetical protein NT169_19295 [Chloroflexi bacterium]|nr:hypothetical protein [Chloroflexota bacterium]
MLRVACCVLHSSWFHLALILLVAGLFRLWRIDSIPPGLFGDEATDGLDALDVLAGRGAIFFPANFGREGLHMWLVAGMFRLIGVVPLALRLPSALAGILSALATYWLGLELTKDERRRTNNRRSFVFCLSSFVAPIAALYLATSYWHIHFSRFGIRGVFTPLCGVLAFAAFWRGVNLANERISESANQRIGKSVICNRQSAICNLQSAIRNPQSPWFALSGFFLGLATHFYTASRFFPVFLGGFLVLQAIIACASGQREEALLRRHFWGIVILYAVVALVFAPLGVYFLQHPGSFSQRAGEVVVFKDASPLARMGQAAVANVLQFFAPGRGDMDQFYNLPGRPVFDPLTAVLALIGVAALLWRWRQPAALFLLTWFPALLLPSFLATDRFPTLPRVLGVIPGVYFFPAIGVVAVIAALGRLMSGSKDQAVRRDRHRVTVSPRHLVILAAAALLIHAALTYRDYFRAWGPSQATFDAFEGDMTAAWRWLGTNQPAGHVYLSSDIYRHPTFMLLGEHATVQRYFEHENPNLSWFDARVSLPLPPPGQSATYLIGASAALSGPAAELLAGRGVERDRILAPNGSPALTVVELPASAEARFLRETGLLPVAFGDHLTLVNAAWSAGADGRAELMLGWRTAGPDPAGWPGYRLEVAAGGWGQVVSFDAFRPPEWVAGGGFVTWHRLDLVGDPPRTLRLRLLTSDGRPLTSPDAADGWHEVPIS